MSGLSIAILRKIENCRPHGLGNGLFPDSGY